MNADVEIYVQDVPAHEIYGYERSFHSDVETFVVSVKPCRFGQDAF